MHLKGFYSLSGSCQAKHCHMETITELQETDLLLAPLLEWRKGGMNGEVVNHMSLCLHVHRETAAQMNALRVLWSKPTPCGFMMVSRDEISSTGKWSTDPAEVKMSLCVVSLQHLTSGSDKTLSHIHKCNLKIAHNSSWEHSLYRRSADLCIRYVIF